MSFKVMFCARVLLVLYCAFNASSVMGQSYQESTPFSVSSEGFSNGYALNDDVDIAHNFMGIKFGRKERNHQRCSQALLLNPYRQQLLKELLLGRQHKGMPELNKALRQQFYHPPQLSHLQQTQLQKGGILPVSLQTLVIPLPLSVNAYLGFKSIPGVRVGIIGTNVLLYDNHTWKIYDLMHNIL